jgi:glutamate/tyrosine decarboxylase-like PLP-dependent enzyme
MRVRAGAATEPERSDGAVDQNDADMQLHGWSDGHDELAAALAARIRSHLGADAPLGRTPSAADVADLAAITPGGLGVDEALRLVDDVLLPNNVALDDRRFLAYIPAAPATTAALFDAVVGAFSFSGESWQEAGAAIAAEHAALDWLRRLAGLPAGAAGCFVSGGSAGNLSGLAVARDEWRRRHPDDADRSLAVACAPSAHSSVRSAARLLDLDLVEVPGDDRDRLTGAALADVLADHPVCAVVASAGATNTGAVDELDAVADVCRSSGTWLHVDAAYGGAALCVPELAGRFAGIERADSVVVDPHKWLFAPLDCAALLYRDPAAAARTHRQSAPYLDAFGAEHVNPSDLAFHLTRRTRGLPFWFALVVHGTDAFTEAVRAAVDLAGRAAGMIAAIGPPVRLVMEPELSVVLFDRDGWTRSDWDAWAAAALSDGLAFVAPSGWHGRDVGRLAFLHPATELTTVAALIARLR